jgi:AraC-like DNA-binding protein
MEKAVVLLRETDEPVKFVARQCGYRRVHSFNKAFKAYAQLPPGAYRRTHFPEDMDMDAVESDINSAKSYTA